MLKTILCLEAHTHIANIASTPWGDSTRECTPSLHPPRSTPAPFPRNTLLAVCQYYNLITLFTSRSTYYEKQYEDLKKIFNWYKANRKLITSPPVSLQITVN